MQISKTAGELLQRIPTFKVCLAIGGTSKNTQKANILAGCDVPVATPGRLVDHMSDSAVRDSFRHLDTLVLDEADRLLDMGFLRVLKDIVARLPNKEETCRQGMLFSATIPSRVQKVTDLVLSAGFKFIHTFPAEESDTHERVLQHLIKVPTFASVAPAMVGAVHEEARVVGPNLFKAIIFAPTVATPTSTATSSPTSATRPTCPRSLCGSSTLGCPNPDVQPPPTNTAKPKWYIACYRRRRPWHGLPRRNFRLPSRYSLR